MINIISFELPSLTHLPLKKSTEKTISMVDYLKQLLKEKLAVNNNKVLSNEEKQSILSQVFKKFDIEESEPIINTRV